MKIASSFLKQLLGGSTSWCDRLQIFTLIDFLEVLCNCLVHMASITDNLSDQDNGTSRRVAKLHPSYLVSCSSIKCFHMILHPPWRSGAYLRGPLASFWLKKICSIICLICKGVSHSLLLSISSLIEGKWFSMTSWRIYSTRVYVWWSGGVKLAILLAVIYYLYYGALRHASGDQSFSLLIWWLMSIHLHSLHLYLDEARVWYLVDGVGHDRNSDGVDPDSAGCRTYG